MSREVGSCAGFALPPTAWRRWMPNVAGGGAVVRGRRGRHSSAATPLARMSIREMIGADVESGGLFDPLGERKCGEQTARRDPRR